MTYFTAPDGFLSDYHEQFSMDIFAPSLKDVRRIYLTRAGDLEALAHAPIGTQVIVTLVAKELADEPDKGPYRSRRRPRWWRR